MVDLVYGPAAIERVRTAVGAEARRLPMLTRRVTPPPAAAFGGLAGGESLAGAEGLAAALSELHAVLDAELRVAAARLDDAAGALAAAADTVRAADDHALAGP